MPDISTLLIYLSPVIFLLLMLLLMEWLALRTGKIEPQRKKIAEEKERIVAERQALEAELRPYQNLITKQHALIAAKALKEVEKAKAKHEAILDEIGHLSLPSTKQKMFMMFHYLKQPQDLFLAYRALQKMHKVNKVSTQMKKHVAQVETDLDALKKMPNEGKQLFKNLNIALEKAHQRFLDEKANHNTVPSAKMKNKVTQLIQAVTALTPSVRQIDAMSIRDVDQLLFQLHKFQSPVADVVKQVQQWQQAVWQLDQKLAEEKERLDALSRERQPYALHAGRLQVGNWLKKAREKGNISNLKSAKNYLQAAHMGNNLLKQMVETERAVVSLKKAKGAETRAQAENIRRQWQGLQGKIERVFQPLYGVELNNYMETMRQLTQELTPIQADCQQLLIMDKDAYQQVQKEYETAVRNLRSEWRQLNNVIHLAYETPIRIEVEQQFNWQPQEKPWRTIRTNLQKAKQLAEQVSQLHQTNKNELSILDKQRREVEQIIFNIPSEINRWTCLVQTKEQMEGLKQEMQSLRNRLRRALTLDQRASILEKIDVRYQQLKQQQKTLQKNKEQVEDMMRMIENVKKRLPYDFDRSLAGYKMAEDLIQEAHRARTVEQALNLLREARIDLKKYIP